jgi:predicted acetyltransferase
MAASRLRLRPLRADDEAAFAAAHRAIALDDFVFGLFYEPDEPWLGYVDRLERQRCGVDLAPGLVPATFLVADVDGQLVGRTSIRHELNDHLRREGGHIGYGVLAEHRRRGYATEILRQSLVIARSLGVDRVLVTCDDDNVGSSTIIERCGGVLHSIVDDIDGRPTRRYWIA